MESSVIAGPVPRSGWVVPIRDVPCESVLYDLWDELGSFREAFCEWGERMTAGYDLAHSEGRLPSQCVEIDHEAIRAALQILGIAQVRALTEILRPLWGNRTLRSIATDAHLSPRTVVQAVFGPNSGDNTDKYMAAEEDLLSGEQREARKAFAKRHGITDRVVQDISAAHGIKWKLYHTTKEFMRIEVEKIVRDGESRPRVILEQLASLFKDCELPTTNTISVWKRRM